MEIRLPLREEDIKNLRAGDVLTLSGVLYTARDQAHARLVRSIEEGKELPIPLEGQTIYYTGPAPAKPGWLLGQPVLPPAIGWIPYTPVLLKNGLKGMIGKGGPFQ